MPVWRPRMFSKQYDVFNDYHRSLLVAGPRKGGKTLAVTNKVCRHLWETPGAVVALISKTYKSAKDGGVWRDMLTAVDEWIAGDIGFEYTTISGVTGMPGPKTDVLTKTLQFKVRNNHGGESELMLFSMDNDNEIEGKLKSTRFSMIWISELSLFKSPSILKVGLLQLRMRHLTREQHQFIADTNPSDEGEDSWIYDLFYRQRTLPNHPFPDRQKEFGLIEIFCEDNPFLDYRDIQELDHLHPEYSENQRLRWGRWVKGGGEGGKLLSDKFSRQIHVVGESKEDSIEIDPGTITLYTGWDIGSSVNSVAVILEKRIIGGKSFWMVLREVVSIDLEIPTGEFAEGVLTKIEEIETEYGKKFDLKNWSDDTAVNIYRASADTYDYLTVLSATKGRINLDGVAKPADSVRRSLQLLRQLLKENRLFVSACCPYTIDMFQQLRRGDKTLIDGTRYKHGFDALRYPIYMESVYDMELSESGATPGFKIVSSQI